MEQKFNFFIGVDPTDLEKAKKFEKDDERRYDNMVFEGIASDSSVDTDGEAMEPSGFDISYFKKSGLFNLDHLTTRADSQKSRYWVGEPLDAKVTNNKFWVKGKLWKKSPEARAFWDKCLEMKESGSSRKPGMSIEGKVIERDKANPKKIKRALITNVALTMNPVNSNSYLDLVKGIQNNDFVDYQFDSEKDFKISPILIEYEDEHGNIVVVNRNFKMSVFRKPKTKDEETILKNYRDGNLSEKVFKDFLKKL